jgi:predicted HNH restriction endonuclease
MPYTTKANVPEGFTDLGEKLEMTESNVMDEVENEQEDRVHYPSLYFQNSEALKDLPKEGTAVIHFKKVMEKTETFEINGKSKTRHCVELQINGIKAGESTESEESEPDDEDAIEKGLEEASESNENDND